jgi:hypothetical protein
MTEEVEGARQAANSPENAAERNRNQRRGLAEEQPAHYTETESAATQHPAGEDQARQNAEPPG